MKRLFTSESVTRGHPDKMCDQISDAVLDAILAQDPMARVACEAVVTTGLVFVTGEITTECYVDVENIVRETVRDIGYTRAKYGFDCDSCAVILSLHDQSPDIAKGVDMAFEANAITDVIGAGDQGMMFGYATDETPAFMPLPIYLSHKIVQALDKARYSGLLPYLRPDGKSQVTVEYLNNTPKRIHVIVVSAQHSPDITHATIEADIIEKVVRRVIPANLIDDATEFYINPTGRFVIGGPSGDAGLTGRKIIVDTYGGYAPHGGGAFSGKDPTKVDRSAAYAARWVAKNIVAAKLARTCEVQLAYAIGVSKPISVSINTFGTGVLHNEQILGLINTNFDLSVGGIIRDLGLRRPIYKQTAAYGHFGRSDVDFPWEALDKAKALEDAAKNLTKTIYRT